MSSRVVRAAMERERERAVAGRATLYDRATRLFNGAEAERSTQRKDIYLR